VNQTAEILTLQESTCKRIREMITRGDIASGQRIKESQLARMLGSSRVPVRESLIRLKAEGLVANKPHCGFMVKEYTRKDIIELYQLREVIEGLAASLAAENGTDQQILECKKLHEEFKVLVSKHEDLPEDQKEQAMAIREQICTVDEKLHMLILSMSGNSRLESVFSSILAQRRLCLSLAAVHEERLQEHNFANRLSIKSHEKVIFGIENHASVLAEKEMRDHVAGALHGLLRHMEKIVKLLQ